MGTTPTFQSANGESVIDFTLFRLGRGRRVTDWQVDDEIYTGLDHNSIIFTVQGGRPDHPISSARSPSGWSLRKLDVDKLANYIREERSVRPEDWLGTDAETAAVRFNQHVRAGCDLSVPKRGVR